jgi:HSP20 family protein
MTLVKFRPAHSHLLQNFNPFFENVWGNDPTQYRRKEISLQTPAVNITDQQDAFVLELAAPGLAKEKFQLSLVSNHHNQPVLTIKADAVTETTNAENSVDSIKYTRKEFNFSSFERRFTLPSTADTEGITATYSEGILYVRIPKKEEAKSKEPRQIVIA